jgi:AraC family transcriptional regulator of adaptative response/methylated-DNA-[protein]-cysteine methyltransferase
MLEAQFRSIRKYFGVPVIPGENGILQSTREELRRYFKGELREFSIPMDVPGSEFQRVVWKALTEIPYGETMSYEALAKKIGKVRAARAVGHTNGLNRIGIIIPCHRVVNKNGSLGGYGGGLWRKQALLDLEKGVRVYKGGR